MNDIVLWIFFCFCLVTLICVVINFDSWLKELEKRVNVLERSVRVNEESMNTLQNEINERRYLSIRNAYAKDHGDDNEYEMP